MSTFRTLTPLNCPYRISLCSSGACDPHLEFVRDGHSVVIFAEDVEAVRQALDELVAFVGPRTLGKEAT